MSEAHGILSLLAQNQIDVSQYKKKKTADILQSLDWRIADIVKNTDFGRHQTNQVDLDRFHPPDSNEARWLARYWSLLVYLCYYSFQRKRH